MAVLFGLLASFAWGLSTFLASRVSRDTAAIPLTFWSQLSGVAPLLPFIAVVERGSPDWEEARHGTVAGLGVGISLVLLYMSVRHLPVGIAASIAGALGTLGPVGYSIATGVSPSILTMVGIAVTVIALVVVMIVPARRAGRSEQDQQMLTVPGEAPPVGQVTAPPTGARRWVGVTQAVFSGLAMTVFYVGLAGIDGRVSFWALGESRIGAALVVGPLCLVTGAWLGLGRKQLAAASVVGVTGATGAIFYLLALDQGGLMVVIVPLIALSPGVAVVLGWALANERLTALQVGGLCAAAAGVAAVVSG